MSSSGSDSPYDGFCFQLLTKPISPTFQFPLGSLVSYTLAILAFTFQLFKTLRDVNEAIRGKKKMEELILPQYLVWIFINLLSYMFVILAMMFCFLAEEPVIYLDSVGVLFFNFTVLLPIFWFHQPTTDSKSRNRTILITSALSILFIPGIVIGNLLLENDTPGSPSYHSIPDSKVKTIGHFLTIYVVVINSSMAGIVGNVALLYLSPITYRRFLEQTLRLSFLKNFKARIKMGDYILYCCILTSLAVLSAFSIKPWTLCLVSLDYLLPAFWPLIFFSLIRRDSIYWRKVGADQNDAALAAIIKDLKADHWAVDFNELILDRVVGRGAAGTVHLGNWRGIKVAVKLLFSVMLDEKALDEFTFEVQMLRRLHHPHIVQLLGAVVEAPNYALVTEFCDRGSLMDVIEDKSIVFTWKLRMKFSKDAALGLYYLHTFNPPILHRDIKSSNFLVDRNFNVKLGDLGGAQLKDNNSTLTFQGTPRWAAPEVMKHSGFSEKSDVFSYGIVLWEILTRQLPFAEYNFTGELCMKVINDHLRPEIPHNCPPAFQELMQCCWDQEPDNRPTMQKVLADLSEFGDSFVDDSEIEIDYLPSSFSSSSDTSGSSYQALRDNVSSVELDTM